MSVAALNWAFQQITDQPVDKLILLALADYANDVSECWPSRKKLAERGMCSVDTVDRALKRMGGRFISIERRTDPKRGHTSSMYTLHIEAQHVAKPSRKLRPASEPVAASPKAPQKDLAACGPTSRKTTPNLAASCYGPPGRNSTAPIEPSPEPPLEPLLEPSCAKRARSEDLKNLGFGGGEGQVSARAENEVCDELGLPNAKSLKAHFLDWVRTGKTREPVHDIDQLFKSFCRTRHAKQIKREAHALMAEVATKPHTIARASPALLKSLERLK